MNTARLVDDESLATLRAGTVLCSDLSRIY